jgi:hypothetical protein
MLQMPEIRAGPSDRAGFIDAPQIGPENIASSSIPLQGHHTSTTQVARCLEIFDLRFTKNVLKMTDAERRSCKKIEKTQSRAIAKALIDIDEVHDD